MTTSTVLHPRYITDEGGKHASVILPASEYESLLEDLEDLAAMAEHRDQPGIPHDEVLAGLRRDGLL
jgi:PHD/YefM family antitoxin component YafN of YafNO toxin-antitoxin module